MIRHPKIVNFRVKGGEGEGKRERGGDGERGERKRGRGGDGESGRVGN
jgi:hypothetical protein